MDRVWLTPNNLNSTFLKKSQDAIFLQFLQQLFVPYLLSCEVGSVKVKSEKLECRSVFDLIQLWCGLRLGDERIGSDEPSVTSLSKRTRQGTKRWC